MTDHRTKVGLLIAQTFERAAFLGLVPFLPDHLGRSLALSEGTAAGWLSVFLCLSYVASYPLGHLSRILSPQRLCLFGCALAGLGYLSLALGSIWGFALGAGLGAALWRVGFASAVASLPKPAWWSTYLATNVGGMLGAAVFQACYWRWGDARPLGLAAAALVVLAGGLTRPHGGAQQAAAPSLSSDEDRMLLRQRLWAVRVVCWSSLGTWLVTLQASTSLVLFVVRYTTPGVLSFRLGTGSYGSIHSGMVVIVTMIAVLRGLNSSGVGQAIFAQVISGAAFAVLAGAASFGLPVSAWWLLGAYALLSVGEPYAFVAWSESIGRLAPASHRSWAFGLWYGCMGLGMMLGAIWGLLWDRLSPERYFASLAILLLLNAAVLLRLSSRLQNVVARC